MTKKALNQFTEDLIDLGYSNIRMIGQGGMGTVFYARKDSLGRDTAIKVVSPERVSNEYILGRFNTEMRTMAGLDHPAIVPIYDGGVSQSGVPYFVMKFVKGTNLEDIISARRFSNHKFSVDEVAYYLRPIASALDYLAALPNPVVHRDIKPANILVPAMDPQSAATQTASPTLLTDFGVAINDEATRMTSVGMRVGTDAYLAPELYVTKFNASSSKLPEPTAASDQYSLALVAFEMLTLVKLRNVVTDQQWATNRPVPKVKNADLNQLNGPHARAISKVISRGLHLNPEWRHDSAGQFIDELVAAAHSQTSAPAAPLAPAQPTAVQGPANFPAAQRQPADETRLDPSPAPASRPQQHSKSRKGLIAAAAAAIVLAAGGAGAWALLSGGKAWEGANADLAQAFPKVISEANGGTGFNGLECGDRAPEAGQKAKISCSGDNLTMVAADYGDAGARDAIKPSEGLQELTAENCSVSVAQLPGDKPTYGVYPNGNLDRYAFILTGPEAESSMYNLPVC